VRRARILVSTLAAASLLMAGCGKDDSSDKSSDQQTEDGSSFAATWPLTGLPVAEGQDSAQKHPVYIAKIDNTPDSDPQIGLGKADLIVEELVEGGITRLAAFYYSQTPSKVGPLRSMRLTDIGIAKPVGAQLITSGAAPVTLAGLSKAGVKFIDMNNQYVVRETDGSHDSLHSVMGDLGKIAKSAGTDAVRPADYMPWGTDADFPGGQKATKVLAQISGYRTSEWKYADGHYTLTNGYMPKDDRFQPETVITCMVKTSIASYKDPAGNPVPISHFEGQGKAMVFHNGQVVRGTWKKDDLDKPVTFYTMSGQLAIPAGHVWIELVPIDGGKVSYK
jgi:hypothetical protein